MLAKVISCAIVGLEGAIVEVEADMSPGLPSFTIVGLPDAAVQEARERVRAAIRNSDCTFPMKRIIVNLAPADLQKSGPAYDLPIAIGILLSSEQVFADVSKTHWAYAYIEPFQERGITRGCYANGAKLYFCPDSDVNRDQMAVFLARAFGLEN